MEKGQGFTPGREAIVALVELRPVLARPPGTRWSTGERAATMPYLPLDDAERALVERARRHGWVTAFDWTVWQGEAERYVREPERLRDAGFEELRRLLTTHIRKERFSEGHLRAMRTCGHLDALLARLEALAG